MEMLKSDLEKIKSTACTFLYCSVNTTVIPAIVKHPFTDSAFVSLPLTSERTFVDITDGTENIELWRSYMKEIIQKSDSAMSVMNLITKPYKLAVFKQFEPFLSKEDYGRLLKSVWTTAEAPNLDPNFTVAKLVALFKKADNKLLMTKEELDIYNGFSEFIKVYRGVQSKSAQGKKALSWTTNKETALYYASRFKGKGKVLSGVIQKKFILAYFLNRGEYEVVLDPRKIVLI